MWKVSVSRYVPERLQISMTRKIEEVHRYSSGNAGFRRGAGGKQSEFRAVVKKLPEPNRKDEVAEKGMVNGGEQERA